MGWPTMPTGPYLLMLPDRFQSSSGFHRLGHNTCVITMFCFDESYYLNYDFCLNFLFLSYGVP